MCCPVDLFVFLYLLVDLFVGLFTPFALLRIRFGGAAAEAAHDDGRRPAAAARRMLLIRRFTRRIGDVALFFDRLRFRPAASTL